MIDYSKRKDKIAKINKKISLLLPLFFYRIKKRLQHNQNHYENKNKNDNGNIYKQCVREINNFNKLFYKINALKVY